MRFVASYKVGARGKRGRIITLPPTWIKDTRIALGDRLDVYRDEADHLIIVARTMPTTKVVAATTEREVAE